jgi:Spy/CpxP family protein refolding chaperone
MLKRSLPALSWTAVLTIAASTVAQPPGRGNGTPGNAPAGRTGDIQKQLGASDEEWKVIAPKLQKVIAARQVLAADLRGPDAGGFGGPVFVGGGGFGGGAFGGPGRGGRGGFDGPGGGGPGGRGGFGGPPQPGQVMPAFLQDVLGLTAEQKKQLEVLQKEVDDKLAKILTEEQKKQLKEMPQGFGRGGFGGPPGGPGGPGENAGGPGGPGGGPPRGFGGGGPGGPMGGGNSPISQAQADLKTLLSEPKHSAAEVKEKVAAVRKARQKARADLEAAQKDLLRLLTAEQEAVLVSLGYLD